MVQIVRAISKSMYRWKWISNQFKHYSSTSLAPHDTITALNREYIRFTSDNLTKIRVMEHNLECTDTSIFKWKVLIRAKEWCSVYENDTNAAGNSFVSSQKLTHFPRFSQMCCILQDPWNSSKHHHLCGLYELIVHSEKDVRSRKQWTVRSELFDIFYCDKWQGGEIHV